VFVSATNKLNVEELRQVVYEEVRKKHLQIYPNYVPNPAFQQITPEQQ
jgi:hypothetical protein